MEGSVIMHWAYETANRIINERPNQSIYTVAAGISPSGNVHIGNFREVATTYFVAQELRNLGKEVRFIFSWDDFDRLRKVPQGFDDKFKECIGLPYSRVPYQGTTYADYFEKQFENELSELGIEVEFLYQNVNYRQGLYDIHIQTAIDKRKEIYDIINSFKTQESSIKERDAYYPITIYCDNCGKDETKVIEYQDGQLTYQCKCGCLKERNLVGGNIKLIWKVDWAMRWMYENVVFEPGGRDHSSATGSFNVSKVICKEIFSYEPPIYIPYDFIGIKGGTTKISSSSGQTVVISDLLKIYDKEIILWYYAKYRNNIPFNISLDEDVLRYYSEFDRYVNAYYKGVLKDEKMVKVLELSNISKDYADNVSFNNLVSFLPMVKNDVELLRSLLEKDNQNISHSMFKSRLKRAISWLELYSENRRINILKEFNQQFFETLSLEERGWVTETHQVLLNNKFSTTSELQSSLYAIPKNHELSDKELKTRQKKYFNILYNMLLGLDKGPKLSLLFFAFSSEEYLQLLKK